MTLVSGGRFGAEGSSRASTISFSRMRSTRQLSATGSVRAAVDTLNSRRQQIESRQNDFRTRVDESQRAVEASARRYGFGAVGAGAYLGIFGL